MSSVPLNPDSIRGRIFLTMEDKGISQSELARLLNSNQPTIAVRAHFGCASAFVHHSGYDTSRARGTTSLEQAVDWSIRAELSDGNRVLKCSKQRDAAPFEPIGFRLTAYAPSMIVEPADAPELDPETGLKLGEAKALDALKTFSGPVSRTLWMTTCKVAERTFDRAIGVLTSRGLVVKHSTGYQLPHCQTLPMSALAVEEQTAANCHTLKSGRVGSTSEAGNPTTGIPAFHFGTPLNLLPDTLPEPSGIPPATHWDEVPPPSDEELAERAAIVAEMEEV